MTTTTASDHSMPSCVKRRARLGRACVGALVALAMLAACGRSSVSGNSGGSGIPAGPIKIGVAVEQTGQFSFYGQENLNALRLSADQINQAGGVLGHKIQLDVRDTASDPSQAVTATRALVSADHVDALIGLGLLSEAKAIMPIVAQKGPPTYSLCAIFHPQLPQQKMAFVASIDNVKAYAKSMAFLAHKGLKRVALLTTNDATGQATLGAAKTFAKQAGLTLVSVQTIDPNTTDATPQLSKIQSSHPQAIFAGIVGRPTAVTLKGMKQLGMSEPVMTSLGNFEPAFLKILAAAQNGPVYTLGTKDLVWRDVPKSDPRYAAIHQFESAYLQKYGAEAGVGGGTGHDALLVLTKAIEQAKSTDPSKIVSAVQSMHNLPGVLTAYNFSATDHRGVPLSSAIPIVLQNGKLKPAVPLK